MKVKNVRPVAQRAALDYILSPTGLTGKKKPQIHW